MKNIIIFIICFLLMGGVGGDTNSVSDSIIGLHIQTGPGKEYTVWHECGKRLNSLEAESRALQYSEYIKDSITDVYERWNEEINPDHVVAILYRESSDDECAIGRKELDRLRDQSGYSISRKNIIGDLKKWRSANMMAHKVCSNRDKSVDLGCLDREMAKRNPGYKGIYAWDIGAGQFRWPGSRTRNRSVKMPDGRLVKNVGIDDLLEADVSIQMLVEDLALYKRACRSHTHWLTRKGRKVRILETEEAYFVHHHTGEVAWSSDYWRRVNRHIENILSRRHGVKIASNGRFLF